MPDASHLTRHARSFDAVAEAYDQYRPGYPAELLTALRTDSPGPRALEIGAGTGLATQGLIAAGFEVTAVEPGAPMAEILVRRTAEHPPAAVEVATFEEYAERAGDVPLFDVLVSATAWHWTSPGRLDRAARLVRPGGRLALLWNAASFDDLATTLAVLDLWTELGLTGADRPREPLTPEELAEIEDETTWPADEIAEHPAFTFEGTRRHERAELVTGARYAAYLGTTSYLQVLEPTVRDQALAGLVRVVDDAVLRRGPQAGSLRISTECYLARRV